MKKTIEPTTATADNAEPTIDSAIEITRIKQTLKCVLTEAELLKAAREMADAQNEAAELEQELKNLQAQKKNEIAIKEGTAAAKGGMIRCGYEFRQVDCEVIKDFKSGMVSIVRQDTGAIIETREITESEAQARMDI